MFRRGRSVKAEPVESHAEPMAVENSDEESDPDPIVREIDVYLSPELSRTAVLVQFPLRPSPHVLGGGGDSPQHPLGARTKPRNAMLELDYPIPRPAYRRDGPDGEELSESRTFPSQAVQISTHMALGRLDETGSRLDLVPLGRVLQMRPSFSHIDAADPSNATAAVADQQQQLADASGASKPLLFRKKESDRAASARRASYANLLSERDAEDWVDLHVVGAGEPEHAAAMAKVACPQRSRTLKLLRRTRRVTGADAGEEADGNRAYVDSLNYLPGAADLAGDGEGAGADRFAFVTEGPGETSAPSGSAATEEPEYRRELAAKVASVLSSSGGAPVPFPVLAARFSKVPEGTLVDCASSAAALVRGNFVLKSNLCGLSAEVTRARDVCLVLLDKYGWVRRKELKLALERSAGDRGSFITEHLINMMLDPVTTKADHCREFRVEDDDEFALKFPTQAQRHKEYWASKRGGSLKEYVDTYENLLRESDAVR